MKAGIQTFLIEAGEAACYALDILQLAEKITGKTRPVIETLIDCIERKFIYFNWNNQSDNDNFTVLKPDSMLSYLTDIRWSVTKESGDYKARINEWIVERWERVKTGTVIGHFRLHDWDSLSDSQTVKYGKIASTRVFRKV